MAVRSLHPDTEPPYTPAEAAKALGMGKSTVIAQLNAAAVGGRRVVQGPWLGCYRIGTRWKIPAHVLRRRMGAEAATQERDNLAALLLRVEAIERHLSQQHPFQPNDFDQFSSLSRFNGKKGA